MVTVDYALSMKKRTNCANMEENEGKWIVSKRPWEVAYTRGSVVVNTSLFKVKKILYQVMNENELKAAPRTTDMKTLEARVPMGVTSEKNSSGLKTHRVGVLKP